MRDQPTTKRTVWRGFYHAPVLFVAALVLAATGLSLNATHYALADDGATTTHKANEAFVTNQTGDSITVVDLNSFSAIAEISVPGKPAGVAVSPDRRWVYVTVPDGKALVVIDAEARKVAARVPLGQGPLGIAVSPRTGLVYVADWYEHKIYEVDAAGFGIRRTFATGRSPSGVAVTPDGERLLSADRDNNAVSIFDLQTGNRVAEIATGTRPFGLTIDKSGTRAFAANVKSNDVTIINLKTEAVEATVPVGRRPYAVALTERYAFVTDQYAATVSVIGLEDFKRVKTIAVDDYPEGIASDRARGQIYVACWEADTLQRIDAETLAVTGSADVGAGPRAFGAFLR